MTSMHRTRFGFISPALDPQQPQAVPFN